MVFNKSALMIPESALSWGDRMPYGKLMFSLIASKSFWGQTAMMLVVLAVVLAILRALTSRHYFMAAVTASYGFVIGWFAGWLARGREARR